MMVVRIGVHKMWKHSVLNLVLVLVLVCWQMMGCCSITTFVFGDSLVDAGNNNYLFTLSKANSPPYGIDFKPSAGLPTGRFTNGRTIPDIVGQELGSNSFPPPYLAPNNKGDAIIKGINYASGASGILDETGSLFIGRVPLEQQISYFEESRNYMVNVMGENGTTEFLKTAIFSLTTGSNDILNYVQPSIPFLQGDKRLHELGARKFIIVDVGPLGCIPFVRALNLLPIAECSIKVNQLIKGYNKKLKNMVNGLNQELGPEAMFVYANSFDIVLSIILDYHQYGFENGFEPCCGGNFPPFVCFKESNGGAMSSVLCDNREKYVFWDAYHPTEAANIIIAKKLLDGDQSVSFPINIRQLYHYNSY
ncbi:GDSL esterase/lipase At5g41890 isoform X2 [Mercurialis annua]|uniref:GDSL esterase/lipase At5g41890 isoform X2 n=1 Tax=Mercurialis annua TaxID=3986 RepID=UPI002160E4FD|nr:GDSL esterase/lipase At5g41890 isoform X2 [Mercurialis annua]